MTIPIQASSSAVAGESPAAGARRKKSVAEKKLEKRIMRLAGKAICDFQMIEEGDKVGIAVSGGKDSYVLLETLMKLRLRAPVHFDIIAINVDMNLPGFPHDLLPAYLEKAGVPYHIAKSDTYSVIRRLIPSGVSVCSLCSRLRRGILYTAADSLGITKIALGHQMDDIVSTLLLNMFYSGRIKAMPPKLRSDDGGHVIIRPLAYIRESETSKWAQIQNYPLIPKNLCGLAENKKRQEIKELIRQWDREDKDRVFNTFMSLSRVTPSHLMDRSLWDFEKFEPVLPPKPELKPRVSHVRFQADPELK